MREPRERIPIFHTGAMGAQNNKNWQFSPKRVVQSVRVLNDRMDRGMRFLVGMNSYLSLFVFIAIIIAVDSGILRHRRFVNQEAEAIPGEKAASEPDVIGSMNGDHSKLMLESSGRQHHDWRRVLCGESRPFPFNTPHAHPPFEVMKGLYKPSQMDQWHASTIHSPSPSVLFTQQAGQQLALNTSQLGHSKHHGY
ncbi:hypothetical protein niasHT_009153 [Heterodera trifolii]|uniref:Uncharacterized protein n=1 Tax=Heterodera trifolii TaxID=157864 RepID=A0ABD2MFF5_9BILA